MDLRAPGAVALPTGMNMASPMAAALVAAQHGIDIDRIERMLKVQQEWEAGEARKAYVRDMAEFKKNAPTIIKDKQVNIEGRDGKRGASYSHATIGNVVETVVASLAAHGFSHNWSTVQKDGRIIVSCVITHREGHSESTTLDGAPDGSGSKNSIQQVASTVTYLQRYTLLLALGLATKDQLDDDGAGKTNPTYDPAAELAIWTERVNQADTVEKLRGVRELAGKAFKNLGDVDGWNTIKALCADRKAVLERTEEKAAA